MKPNTKTVATYVTSRGNVALEVTRHTGHDGRVTYSYVGKHGAGSGHGLEHVKSTVRVMLDTHKGIKLTRGWDMLNEPEPSPEGVACVPAVTTYRVTRNGSIVQSGLGYTAAKSLVKSVREESWAKFYADESVPREAVQIEYDDAAKQAAWEASPEYGGNRIASPSPADPVKVLPSPSVVPVEVPASPPPFFLAFMSLIADAVLMDERLLKGQPDPGCEKGSITRARIALTEAMASHAANLAKIKALELALKDCVESLSRLPDTDGAYRVTCLESARAALALPSA